MSTPITHKTGRKPGRGAISVPRDEHAGIELLAAFGWGNHDIGNLWDISPDRVGTILSQRRRA
jgi:hypothetical protein